MCGQVKSVALPPVCIRGNIRDKKEKQRGGILEEVERDLNRKETCQLISSRDLTCPPCPSPSP